MSNVDRFDVVIVVVVVPHKFSLELYSLVGVVYLVYFICFFFISSGLSGDFKTEIKNGVMSWFD